jgi:transcriptional regulator with XRE-family HTH domain
MPSLNMSSLGEYIREQREQAEVSLRQLARSAGVSNPYLSQVERGLRRPSADILQQIAQGLRISAETLYVRAGLLEERDGERTPTVAASVLSDPVLTQRQKRTLLDVYDAFCRETVAALPEQAAVPSHVPAGRTARSTKPARTTDSRRPEANDAPAGKAAQRKAAQRKAAPRRPAATVAARTPEPAPDSA